MRLTLSLSAFVLICSCSQPPTPPVLSTGIKEQDTTSIEKEQFTTGLEFPSKIPGEELVSHIGYSASYNHKTLMPNWVAYELTADELKDNYKGKESFQHDPSLKGIQPNREDYKNTLDWNRGHMAPKADMKWSVQAYEESFYLSNVCPQNRQFNDGAWKTTEDMARRIAKTYGSVYIICGPIIGDNVHGSLSDKKIIIPDKFFKAFLIRKGKSYSAIAFVMNNSAEKQNLKASSMAVDALEEILQLDLFCNLDKKSQKTAEAEVRYGDWGI